MEKLFYCLRVNGKLEAMVDNVDDIAKRSRYFSDGIWYEYDMKNNIIYNERLYEGNVEFNGLKEESTMDYINYDANISF
ncbi:MAG: hypothetical protein ACOC33_00095 [bacterium]